MLLLKKQKGFFMFKEIFYTGIGATALIREKIEEEMKTLEEKGKIKTEDAKSFMESIEVKGKEEDKRLKEEFKESIREIIEELGVATKKDIEQLKEDLKSKD